MSSDRIVYNWWMYKNIIDQDTIDKILQLGEKAEWENAAVGSLCEDEKRFKDSIRKTDLIWLNDQWLYDIFWSLMLVANQQAGWNFEISCAESFQLGRYGEDCHYRWHSDGIGFLSPPGATGLLSDTTRKISMVCWLNEDFKGGEFEFMRCYGEENQFVPSKGTVMFFPAWIVHRVKPVLEGTRYSLVTWFNGHPIR